MPDARLRLEEVYDAYSGLILAYAARRLENPQDAADIVADTFLVAWRRIDDLPDGSDARLWLYGVARRVLANHRRGKRRRKRLDERLTREFARLVAHFVGDVAVKRGGHRVDQPGHAPFPESPHRGDR